MTVEWITPQEGAALLLTWLQTHGAIIDIVDPESGAFVCDLTPIHGLDEERATCLAIYVESVRDEINALLLAERIRH